MLYNFSVERCHGPCTLVRSATCKTNEEVCTVLIAIINKNNYSTHDLLDHIDTTTVTGKDIQYFHQSKLYKNDHFMYFRHSHIFM